MEIVLATTNAHKVEEFNELAKDFDLKFVGLNDINFKGEIIEDGKTFKENSLIKAKAVSKFTDKIILADDSGIEIEALGEHSPGIYSHRYATQNGGFLKNNARLAKLYHGSRAFFFCYLTVINLEDEPLIFEGKFEGTIANTPENVEGFGYDPIFIPKGMNHPVSTIPLKEKDKISHRALAFNKFLKYLKDNNLLFKRSSN